MLDPKLLRTDIESVAEQLLRRGYELDKEFFSTLEQQRKSLQVETQELQNIRNQRSKEIGAAKSRGEDIDPLKQAMDDVAKNLKEKEQRLQQIQSELHQWLLGIPNIPDDSVPIGKSEEDNVFVRSWGEPAEFDFEVRWQTDEHLNKNPYGPGAFGGPGDRSAARAGAALLRP